MSLGYPLPNTRKLVVGSRWKHCCSKKNTVKVLSVNGIMVVYEKNNGKRNEITAAGFLYTYRPLEADKQ